MRDDDLVIRGPGVGTIVGLSFIISIIVSGAMILTLREIIPPKPLSDLQLASEAVDVPSLLGVDVAQARGLLDPKGLLLTLDAEREDAVPAGSICVQAPLAGSRVMRGATIHATVSRGQAKVRVPDVSGQAADKAARALADAALTQGPTDQQAHATIPSGSVINTTPPAGSEVAKGSAVALHLSTGPAGVEVPKVTGLVINKARELLAAQKLNITTKTGYDSEHGDWIVLTQDPAAGAKVAPGSTVHLLVNDGQ
jgi:beta-lactam-binding protein with PASTA domain